MNNETIASQTPAAPIMRKKPTVERKLKKERIGWPFPRVALEKAISVSKALKEKNAGNPWPPEEVASAVKLGSKSTGFFYLTAGARDYGLTEGTSTAGRIALTDLGRDVVYHEMDETGRNARLKAFLKVDVFEKVLNYYKGSNLPEREFLAATLKKEFHLDPKTHDEFVKVFRANCKFLGIGEVFTGNETTTVDSASGNGTSSPSDGAVITLSKPAKGKGPLCFVIMPFTERQEAHRPGFFKEVLDGLIVPACSELGFIVRSAKREGSDVIQSTIVNDLLQADLVVADLTEHNPNVLFELGMRMAEDRPVALIRAKGTGKIFDVDNMLRVFDYDPCLWPSTIKTDLPNLLSHVKATWENRASDVSYMKLLRKSQPQLK